MSPGSAGADRLLGKKIVWGASEVKGNTSLRLSHKEVEIVRTGIRGQDGRQS